MRRLIASETEDSIALMKWARLKKLPLIHIQNEAKYEKKSYINKQGKKVTYCPGGIKSNAKGREKGFPDFFLFVPAYSDIWTLDQKYYSGLGIELKRKDLIRKKVKIEQIIWIERLRSYGYAAEVCYGWD